MEGKKETKNHEFDKLLSGFLDLSRNLPTNRRIMVKMKLLYFMVQEESLTLALGMLEGVKQKLTYEFMTNLEKLDLEPEEFTGVPEKSIERKPDKRLWV